MSPKVQFHIQISTRVEAHHHRCNLMKAMPWGMSSLYESWEIVKQLLLLPEWMAGNMQSWRGSNWMKTMWDWFYRNRREFQEEAHCQLHPHLQELLNLVEHPGGERWCAGAPLGIGQWMVQDSPSNLPWSKEKEVLRELHGGPSGAHLGINKTTDDVRQWYLLFTYIYNLFIYLHTYTHTYLCVCVSMCVCVRLSKKNSRISLFNISVNLRHVTITFALKHVKTLQVLSSPVPCNASVTMILNVHY
jgi:hypothetical protein